MAGRSRSRTVLAVMMVTSMSLAGCFGGGESDGEGTAPWDSGYHYIDLPSSYEDPRDFTVGDLAATKEGWILNFGGEYPTWSEDRGRTWQEWRPTILSQFGCLLPKPTVPGQEGLGEGSIVQATNGDLIAMGWFPYPSTSGADQFYAFFYDAEDQDWSWCYNRPPEAFYDRSWQVEVTGPISSIYGSGPWASIVISNFWHQVANRGGQISTDGLNYQNFDFPDRDANLDVMEVDLDFLALGVEWDYTKPHKEMRAFPVPSGGLYFPDYFDNDVDAYLDTSLSWWAATNSNGSSLPSQYCSFDSSTALHCVTAGVPCCSTCCHGMAG